MISKLLNGVLSYGAKYVNQKPVVNGCSQIRRFSVCTIRRPGKSEHIRSGDESMFGAGVERNLPGFQHERTAWSIRHVARIGIGAQRHLWKSGQRSYIFEYLDINVPESLTHLRSAGVRRWLPSRTSWSERLATRYPWAGVHVEQWEQNGVSLPRTAEGMEFRLP